MTDLHFPLSTTLGDQRPDDPIRLAARARDPLVLIVAMLVFTALCSVFILHPFTPSFPEAGLDPSWTVVIGEQAAAHARWGVDLDFTYGPASPLVTLYYNSQYFALTLPLLVMFCLVHGGSAAVLLVPRRGSQGWGLWSCLCAVSAYAVALLATRQNPDAFYFSTIFLTFLVDLDRLSDDRVAKLAVLLGVTASGIFVLSKLTYGLAAIPLFCLADLRALGRRQLPWRLGLMGLAFLAADLAYGQRLADVPQFLLTQKDIIGGYTEAMSLPGSRLELFAFLAFAAIIGGATLIGELRSPRPWPERFILPLGLAVVILLVFKAGFVRADLHTLISWTSAGLIGLMIALSRLAPRWPGAASALALLSLFVLVVVYPFVVVVANDDQPYGWAMVQIYRSWFFEGPPQESAAMQSALTAPARFAAMLDQSKANAWSAIKEKSVLPNFEGTIDIIQSDQSTIIANGLGYHPRPSFQEYFTYAPGLMAANQAFYAGDRAPDWLLFAPGSIDDRPPASAEGALWPLLLRRYEPVQMIDAQVALRRREQPDADILGPPTRRTARFDEPVKVEPGAVFAKITVHPTVLGRLAGLLYRPPMLNMVVQLATGQDVSYRFIPNLGAGGFLLSPLVNSAYDYTQLALGGIDNLAGNRVVAVRMVGNSAASFAFAPQVDYEFSSLDLSRLTHDAAADPLFHAVQAKKSWYDFVQRVGRGKFLNGDQLPFQPPDALSFATGTARRLRIGFGIESAAWKEGKSDGVCFSLTSGERPQPLWTRCLDPMRVAADQGPQTVEVDLAKETSSVTLKAECRVGCDWGWSYLDDVEFLQ